MKIKLFLCLWLLTCGALLQAMFNQQPYSGGYGGQGMGQGRSVFGGQPSGQYMGQGRSAFGGQPSGQYMGQGRSAFGGQPSGQYMGQGRNAFGGQPSGQYMGQGRNAFGGQPSAQYMGQSRSAFARPQGRSYSSGSGAQYMGQAPSAFGWQQAGEHMSGIGGYKSPVYDGKDSLLGAKVEKIINLLDVLKVQLEGLKAGQEKIFKKLDELPELIISELMYNINYFKNKQLEGGSS
jgi:hypothetical protein